MRVLVARSAAPSPEPSPAPSPAPLTAQSPPAPLRSKLDHPILATGHLLVLLLGTILVKTLAVPVPTL
jgi:hypothetical protein